MVFFQVFEVRKLSDPVPLKVGNDGLRLIIKIQSFPNIEGLHDETYVNMWYLACRLISEYII